MTGGAEASVAQVIIEKDGFYPEPEGIRTPDLLVYRDRCDQLG